MSQQILLRGNIDCHLKRHELCDMLGMCVATTECLGTGSDGRKDELTYCLIH